MEGRRSLIPDWRCLLRANFLRLFLLSTCEPSKDCLPSDGEISVPGLSPASFFLNSQSRISEVMNRISEVMNGTSERRSRCSWPLN